jgi:hypothetical protein
MKKTPNLAITKSMNYKEILRRIVKPYSLLCRWQEKILLKRNDIVALKNSTEI